MHKLRSLFVFLFLLLSLIGGNGVGEVYAQKRTPQKTTTQKKQTSKSSTSKATTQKTDKKDKLRKEREATIKARKAQQEKAAKLNKNIRQNLDSVMILDNKIIRSRMTIDSLSREINILAHNIDSLTHELDSLKSNLEVRKKHYSKALVYMRRNRSLRNKMMFVFSADNFTQLTRRIRYLNEYSTFQKAQAEIIKAQQIEVKKKQDELVAAKARIESNRAEMQSRKKDMEMLKSSCQIKVEFLNKNLLTVQEQIKIFQKKEASLDAEIERIVQEEVAAARRAQEERNRRAQETKQKIENSNRDRAKKLSDAKSAQERARRAVTQAEEKRRQAEAARKAAKTEAERVAAEKALAQAKAEEERAKAAAKSAEADVKQVTKTNAAAEKTEKTELKAATTWSSNDSDVKLSSSFANNKGKLPMPITGRYSLVGRYGNYSPTGLSKVVLENMGIDIQGEAGAQARSIFDGVVTKVVQYSGRYIVMVRHGSYISVYAGLQSTSVSSGQKVSAKQSLGAVARNGDGKYVLQFQLRREGAKMNPQSWLRW